MAKWRELAVHLGSGLIGGMTGALLGLFLPGASFDWAPLLAALVALYAAHRGVTQYFRKQERDEISRRWIDEGFNKVGTVLASDLERERTNWTICAEMIKLFRAGVDPGVTSRLTEQLDRTAPMLGYDQLRLCGLFPSSSLVLEGFAAAYGQLRAAHLYFAIEVPETVANLRTALASEARAERLKELKEDVCRRAEALDGIDSLVLAFANLAQDFEAAGFTSHAEIQDIGSGRRLKDALSRFAQGVQPLLRAAGKVSGTVQPDQGSQLTSPSP